MRAYLKRHWMDGSVKDPVGWMVVGFGALSVFASIMAWAA